MRKLTVSLLAVYALMVFVTGCAGDSGGDKKSDKTQEPEVKFTSKEDGVFDTQRKNNIKKIFRGIPSPIETAELIKKSGASFDLEILNSPDNAQNYISASSQAINLGVYGADLSYTSMFEQDKQSIFYFDAVTELAKQLDVDAALENGLLERLKTNKENQDSLMAIITDTYWNINAYLKENEAREEISAMVIAGGWMEGLYLAGMHYTPGNKELRERIAEQKYVLGNLCDLMATYKGEDIQALTADLQSVQEVYADVEIEKGKTTKEKDASGMVVLGGDRKVSMNDVTLDAVLSKIKEIRNKYIK